MGRVKIEIIHIGETDFQIKLSFINSAYLNPIELKASFDEDIKEYQYCIKDLVLNDIIETGWLSTDDVVLAKGLSIQTLLNFFEKQTVFITNSIKSLSDCLTAITEKKEE